MGSPNNLFFGPKMFFMLVFQKKKCNSRGIFPGLVVFLGVFLRNSFEKNRKM